MINMSQMKSYIFMITNPEWNKGNNYEADGDSPLMRHGPREMDL